MYWDWGDDVTDEDNLAELNKILEDIPLPKIFHIEAGDDNGYTIIIVERPCTKEQALAIYNEWSEEL